MALSRKIKEYFDIEKIPYSLLEHEPAFSAMEIAQKEHVPGKQFIKPVIVRADGHFIMCVLPAIHLIDFSKLKSVLQAESIVLASETDLNNLFEDFELGSEPPLGQLWGLRVYMDAIILEADEIYFSGGTHTDVVKIRLKDYIRLVNPVIADFGMHIAKVA